MGKVQSISIPIFCIKSNFLTGLHMHAFLIPVLYMLMLNKLIIQAPLPSDHGLYNLIKTPELIIQLWNELKKNSARVETFISI